MAGKGVGWGVGVAGATVTTGEGDGDGVGSIVGSGGAVGVAEATTGADGVAVVAGVVSVVVEATVVHDTSALIPSAARAKGIVAFRWKALGHGIRRHRTPPAKQRDWAPMPVWLRSLNLVPRKRVGAAVPAAGLHSLHTHGRTP
jgi:hypothetical protein